MPRILILLVALDLALAAVVRSDAPSDAPPAIPPAGSAQLTYDRQDGRALTLSVVRPRRTNGAAVIWIISGGWESRRLPVDDCREDLAVYLEQGYTAVAIQHRSGPGCRVHHAVADVRRAARYLRHHADRLGFDADRMALLGNSSGGHLALMIGVTGDREPERLGAAKARARDPLARVSARVAAVVALVPPTDLERYVHAHPRCHDIARGFAALDMTVAQGQACSPVRFASRDDAAALIVSAGKDELIPASHGRRLHEALQAAGAASRLLHLPDATHDLLQRDEHARRVNEAVNGWLRTHLGGRQ